MKSMISTRPKLYTCIYTLCLYITLFKTIEALSRSAFFFSTSVELKTKIEGGGGAGREMMDSNTSLPEILTPKHFLAVSVICFDRSGFACTCLSGKFLVHNCG